MKINNFRGDVTNISAKTKTTALQRKIYASTAVTILLFSPSKYAENYGDCSGNERAGML